MHVISLAPSLSRPYLGIDDPEQAGREYQGDQRCGEELLDQRNVVFGCGIGQLEGIGVEYAQTACGSCFRSARVVQWASSQDETERFTYRRLADCGPD